MAQLINKAINPKGESDDFTLEIMPCRSSKIKHVRKADGRPDIAGYSDASSRTVCVPSGKTAFERTIRYHEALHAEHTPPCAFKPKDMLDQALEDSRLHRYASKSASSSCTQARRDELTVALRELRGLRKMAERGFPLGAAQSLATMRAKAILEASTVSPSHAKLLADVCSKIGPNAARDMGRAIEALRESDGDTKGEPWRKARGYAGRYFTRYFDSIQPQPKPKAKTSSDGASGESQRAQSSSSDSESDSDTQSSTGKATPTPNDDSGEDTDEDKDTDGESSGESDGDEDTPDSEDSTSDGENEDEDTGEDIPDEPIAPMEPIKRKLVPTRKASDADEYTADLTPACDAAQFREMNAGAPLKVYIRRPDMGINRVKLDLGRRELLPVMAGSRINPAKLAAARTTPGVRTFQRKVNQGGSGTILIDASGSMGIPESTLVAFCEKAPALTIAFYNAPDDWARHGNIFIYAANGYRANLSCRIHASAIPHYGSGNVIDYHAMAWLIKQPGPHYIVTDCGFTGGPWAEAAIGLFRKLVTAKQLELVPNLTAMAYILEARKRHSVKPVRELVREYFTRQSYERSYIEPKRRQAYIDKKLDWYDDMCKSSTAKERARWAHEDD